VNRPLYVFTPGLLIVLIALAATMGGTATAIAMLLKNPKALQCPAMDEEMRPETRTLLVMTTEGDTP
jgi:hypothetical protein